MHVQAKEDEKSTHLPELLQKEWQKEPYSAEHLPILDPLDYSHCEALPS